MQISRKFLALAAVGLVLGLFVTLALEAQEAVVLKENELARVIPAGFYFDGQSAATQMRNAAAVRFGMKRHVLAALVDTSGYATEVRAKCEGFLIADLPFRIGNKDLGVGSYAFGFTKEGLLNIFDLGGTHLFSIPAIRDNGLSTSRPLAMTKGADGIRLYRGKDYVLIAAK
jgi:hypothetical protein